ncbi:hypothetical protein DSM106972_014670 [Dulcicalothrix desertica PCC 7102]|uniref:Nif11 domain-containing protein n=1 Tax=Dulcicalothrix desertica PCC 7102 TaxID=232991 RepID=A0A433VQD2_9CYAN|nr:Nif11-like leader peptide family natural product precursor [Dulcicalothrix desertica]RUT08299.1 hypothetical protein DSM106972_014670 [Dulcicalothrix desertica PCC 7102]TWH40165.1 nitrogen fixation uncharacterized protein [Dulcicalothrix desertica PCC 7102]
MTKQSLTEFSRLLQNDLNLQKELSAIIDEETFFHRVVSLGAEHGYNFTAEDIGKDSVVEFALMVKRDSNLQEQLKAAGDEKAFYELAVTLGAEHGFTFTDEVLKQRMARSKRQKAAAGRGENTLMWNDLGEQALMSVAGGGDILPHCNSQFMCCTSSGELLGELLVQ